MRKLSFSLLTVTVLLAGSTHKLIAQQKIGCINSNELITLMPENDSAIKVIEKRQLEFVKQSEELQVEFNKKYAVFTSSMDTLPLLIRNAKQEELGNMSTSIDNFNKAADQELNNYRQETYQPILEKAQNAISEVANEEGFTYIIDIATRSLIFFPEEAPLNIMEAVKTKLGIE
ncbi:MAG: OmpH family outer membrane protein [Bacteroidetes bacterium]|jgi:outer membrane protein|nr:OmpH family outer membrane protein [Bacteroidota bacterium]MBT4410787.1 OmpH family outer membrane protein [Bacteroidota bacterium]MBT7465861.1 OmpH family outer membrane protein [Bacteroidota bacterium]